MERFLVSGHLESGGDDAPSDQGGERGVTFRGAEKRPRQPFGLCRGGAARILRCYGLTSRHRSDHPRPIQLMHIRKNELRLLAAGAMLLLTAACGGGDAEKSSTTPLPEGVSAVAANGRIAMPAGNERACQPASIRRIFRQSAEWNGYWQYGFAEHCPRPQLPADFDFSKEMVVLVAMGPRKSPADSIMVQGTGQVGDSVLIVVRRTTRQDGCAEPEVPSYPRDMVRVPTLNGPTRFVEQHVKLPCPTS